MNHRRAILALGICFVLPACPKSSTLTREVLAEPYQQHRGAYLRGGELPTGEGIKWKTQVKGSVTSSAAVFSGVLYITSMLRKENQGFVVAIDYRSPGSPCGACW